MNIRRLRTVILAPIAKSPRMRELTVTTFAAIGRRLGGIEPVLDEAVSNDACRPLDRTLQMIQWATSIGRTAGRLPRHFNPGDHLETAPARRAAAQALHAHNTRRRSDQLTMQIIHVDDELDVTELGSRIRADISQHARQRASRPQRGTGIDPLLQLKIVDQLTRILRESDLTPFLMSGTLLGFVRDGRFLAHDYDIDLGLLPGVDPQQVVDLVAGDPEFDVSVLGDRLLVEHSSGVTTDIFAHWLRDGLFWHGTLVHEWWNTPFDLRRSSLNGVDVWIPDDPELYLKENYGEWANPIAFYDISFDTPNRVYRQSAAALRYLHSACVAALRDGDRWMAESTARELRDAFGIDVTEQLGHSPLIDPRPCDTPGEQ